MCVCAVPPWWAGGKVGCLARCGAAHAPPLASDPRRPDAPRSRSSRPPSAPSLPPRALSCENGAGCEARQGRQEDKRFKRHQSDRYPGLAHGGGRGGAGRLTLARPVIHATRASHAAQESWRKPKGIDSRVRRRFKGLWLMPSIGYGTNAKTRHMSRDGFVASARARGASAVDRG